jgi:hypothetical protein
MSYKSSNMVQCSIQGVFNVQQIGFIAVAVADMEAVTIGLRVRVGAHQSFNFFDVWRLLRQSRAQVGSL